MSPIFQSVDGKRRVFGSIAAASSRRRMMLLVVSTVITVMLVVGSIPIALAATPRAVWVWEDDTFRMLDKKDQWNETFSFLARRNLTTVYLYADEYRGRNIIRDEPEKYRRLIAALYGNGYKVYALLGSWYLKTPEYILPERRAVAVRMFENILRYNAESADGERFDGVNIDIEPYLLDDWNENRVLRATQYLDLAAEFMRLKQKAKAALVVGPAMPFWFDGIDDIEWKGKRQRLSDHVQDIYDYVAIMDYRNFAQGSDGIVAHATDELEYADRNGKTVVIGVETLLTEPRKVTFYGMGLAAMEEQLSIVESEFASRPSFAGFAIHHLGSYRKMHDSR
jgi:hypothetical protein